MKHLEEIVARNYEQVRFFNDDKTGLVSIIAIHSTKLGPALGGCRLKKYNSIEDALWDVLGLAKAMSYKNSLCGIDFGGAKSVIIRDSDFKDNRAEFFQEFGRCVEQMNGNYITAGDMGTCVSDMKEIAKSTSYVSGSDPDVGLGGDPSPYTAMGVFQGIRACLSHVFGSDDFKSRSVAVQGVGKTGSFLVKLLSDAGAKVVVSDICNERALSVAKKYSSDVLSASEIHKAEVDVFSPCATGGVISENSIDEIRAKVIAGAANVQLSDEKLGVELVKRGIVYAPDFAINAGGVIFCAEDYKKSKFSEAALKKRVDNIYQTISSILERSASDARFSGDVALEMAVERVESA